MSITKTIMIRVLPDEQTVEVLERQGKESARWMNKVFRRLYADKRNWNGMNYGPDKDWGKSYGSILVWRPKKKCWKIQGRAFYPAFVRKNTPNRIDSDLGAESLQLLSMKMATTWGNFLNGITPRPRGHLPNFRPVVAIFHVYSKDMVFRDGGFSFSVTHPYDKKRVVEIGSVDSQDTKFKERLGLIREVMQSKGWSAVEVKKHEDGRWYAHIPVTVEAPEPVRQPKRVMGVDVGVRNLMTVAIVNTKDEIPQKSERVPGLPIFHRLERIHARVRKLRSLKDRGNKNTRKALKRLKARRRRIQQTMARQTAARVVDLAVENGVEGIAVEDLRGMRKPGMSRRMNRLITNWARGESRDFMAFKAAEGSLNFKEVYAQGTSSTCPSCGKFDRSARDRSSHLFTCKGCGFSINDDDAGGINIAHRGWKYWNSPKWATSQSTPVAGATGEDSAGNGAGESHNPHSKQPDAESPAASNGAQSEKPENRAIGTDMRVSATSSGSSSRAEPSKVQRPMRQLYKTPRASGKVARGAPGGARTVNKPAGDSPINPATAPRDPHPLENGDPPPIEADPPLSQRLVNL